MNNKTDQLLSRASYERLFFSAENEIAIVKKCQAGDKDAFNMIVSGYQQEIISVCCYYLGNYDEALDCAQDVFISVLKSIKTFKFKASFKTWISRIAVNACFSRRRKYALKFKNVTSLSQDTIFNEDMQCASNSDNIHENLEKNESASYVRSVITTLPRKYKEVLILKYIEGYSNKEIQEILAASENTVKSRLLRGHRAFRKKFMSLKQQPDSNVHKRGFSHEM